MGLSFEDDIRMEAYFNGELSKAEEQQFLDDIAADKELQEEFEFEKFLRGRSNEVEEEDIPLISPYKKPKFNAYLMAASVAGIIAVASFFIYNALKNENEKPVITQQQPVIIDSNEQQRPTDTSHTISIDADKIYREYYTYYEPTGNEPPELGKVMLAYQSHAYHTAFNEVENISQIRGTEKPGKDVETYKLLYKALCLAETNETAKSINAFQQVITTGDNAALKADAQWYLALEFIKSNELQKALPILQLLAKTKSRRSDEASRLLHQIP